MRAVRGEGNFFPVKKIRLFNSKIHIKSLLSQKLLPSKKTVVLKVIAISPICINFTQITVL